MATFSLRLLVLACSCAPTFGLRAPFHAPPRIATPPLSIQPRQHYLCTTPLPANGSGRKCRHRPLRATALAATADDGRRPQQRRHLVCMFGALTSLVAVKATVAQALPAALVQTLGSSDEAARVLATVCSTSAALEFSLLPVVAALSDAVGRRPLLLALPALTVLLRLLVVTSLRPATLITSRVLVGALVNWFFLFVGVSCADWFGSDSAALASLEGKRAAAWGAAFAGGMLVGGLLLSRLGLVATYAVSATLAATAFCFVLFGVQETLPPPQRRKFAISSSSSPLSFLQLFTKGRSIATLACILGLQALHDSEGDVWQLYAESSRGWGTRENSLYGAAVGTASTFGGLLTGASVRALGGRLHTCLWTGATAMGALMFASTSSTLAYTSVLFSCAEDCMAAAVVARLVQAGLKSGIPQGQLASNCANLEAVVRIGGLFLFGRLFSYGGRIGLPALPYFLVAGSQLLAVLLVLSLPVRLWRDGEE